MAAARSQTDSVPPALERSRILHRSILTVKKNLFIFFKNFHKPSNETVTVTWRMPKKKKLKKFTQQRLMRTCANYMVSFGQQKLLKKSVITVRKLLEEKEKTNQNKTNTQYL